MTEHRVCQCNCTRDGADDESATERLARIVGAIYRFGLSPVLHATHRTLTGSTGACRFQPSCSEYAAFAFHLHGPVRGGLLSLRRILRCHPFARGGYDPVPPSNQTARTKPARHLP
jgi:putative membrane protein insertion efficiency factor